MEVSYFFNGDFEDFLASNQETYSYRPNKKNTELEYFILWLEKSLASRKNYNSDYLNFVSKFNDFKIESDFSKAKPWCVDLYDKEKQKRLNSKLVSTQFAIENNLCHKNTEIINSLDSLEEGYIYKEEFGVSGIGTWELSNLPKKINLPIIKDKKLKRVFDFSTLLLGDELIMYQNHVDDFFQYKGTTIGLNFDYFEWIDEYKENISKIKEEFKTDHNPLSIDSFLYEEENEEKVYSLCEINNRKTMGFIAWSLFQKYFQEFRYIRLRLFPRKSLKVVFKHEDLYLKFKSRVIPLSPLDGIFISFLLLEDSLGELNELEDDLVELLF